MRPCCCASAGDDPLPRVRPRDDGWGARSATRGKRSRDHRSRRSMLSRGLIGKRPSLTRRATVASEQLIRDAPRSAVAQREEIHALLRAEPMRPTFTIVFGCDGAGKTIWSRQHRTRLPGAVLRCRDSRRGRRRLGPSGSAEAGGGVRRQPGRPGVRCAAGLRRRERRPVLVERAIAAGYRVEGVYLGMTSPTINVERIWRRVGGYPTGHVVDDLEGLRGAASALPARPAAGSPRLRPTRARGQQPRPDARDPAGVPAVVLERGRPVFEARVLAPWVAATLRLHGD